MEGPTAVVAYWPSDLAFRALAVGVFLDVADPRIRAHLLVALGDHVRKCRRDGIRPPLALVAMLEAAKSGQMLALQAGESQDAVVPAGQAAALLGISPRTLRRYAAAGRITREGRGYRLRELERFGGRYGHVSR